MPAICHLAGLKGQTPIMIDWSDLGRKRIGLFAAVCYRKRGLPLLSWATTHDELNPSQNRLEETFIARLLRNLPDNYPSAVAGRPWLRARQSAAPVAGNAPPHWPHSGLCSTTQGQCPHPDCRWLSGIAAELFPCVPNRYVFLPRVRYRSDGVVTVNLVLYWGRGHREPWYLATSLPDAKVAVGQYRKRMQPEQYFRDGKQYFAPGSGNGNHDGAAGAYAGGAVISLLFAAVGGAAGVVAVPAAGVFVGEAGAAAAGDGALSGYAGAPA